MSHDCLVLRPVFLLFVFGLILHIRFQTRTPIFAQYGFLPLDCTTIFCKAVHLDKQIKELGYDYRDLLIEAQTGEVAPKVSCT